MTVEELLAGLVGLLRHPNAALRVHAAILLIKMGRKS
jgi:hypothetical protein